MADLCAAENAREGAVTGKTLEDQDRAWRRWEQYAESIGLQDDIFLDGFTRPNKNKLMGAFAMALREGRFSKRHDGPLAEGTIRGAISYVASTFRDSDRPNPTKDDDGELGRLLSRLYRAFRNKDPAEKKQKALPARVLVEMSKLQATESQRARFELAGGALFYCMRSCEYLKVPAAETRRTDCLRLRNLKFRRNGAIIPHDSPELEYCENLSITFERQKKDERDDTVTQWSTSHPLLNPVRLWASVVKRIMSYPGTDENTKVSAVWRNNRIEHITSKEIIDAINASAEAIGWDKLGVKKGDFGTHSIRSGGAMAMYLDEIPIYTIMLIGRWSSDAFLEYIRKQVDQFTYNIAERMLKHLDFRHLPLVD